MEYSPQDLAIKRRKLALEYKQVMKDLAELKKRKPEQVIFLLAEHKTISKAELYYSATEDGQKEIELTLYAKGLIETMRAVKTEIEVLQGEAYNQY
jgi:hypothetical protein